MSKYEQRPKKGRVIPFGYKVSEHDPKLLEPIPEQLDALRDAYFYLGTCSYNEVARWLFKKTGRSISDVGLLKLHQKYKKEKQHQYYLNKKIKAKKERFKAIDRERGRAIAEAQVQRAAQFVSREKGATGTGNSEHQAQEASKRTGTA